MVYKEKTTKSPQCAFANQNAHQSLGVSTIWLTDQIDRTKLILVVKFSASSV